MFSDEEGGTLLAQVQAAVRDMLPLAEHPQAPAPLLRYIAKKGSICVDGVSLTVNDVDAEGFEVALIPHTVQNTAFAQTGIGDAINLEIDLVARYVERLLGERHSGGAA